MSANAILTHTVENWERRRRWSVVLERLPYAMLPGIAAATALAIYSRIRPGVSDTVSLMVALGGVVSGIIALLVWVWVIKARTPVESARWFDQNFGLQERVSTALELLEGKIKADNDLTALQVADAEKIAARVKAAAMLPFSSDWRVWAINLVLLAMLAFMLIFVSPAASASGDSERERAAIDDAADDISEIIEDIAADPVLTDEQRGPLLEALQTQLEMLREPDLTLDEALATLGDAQSLLSEAATEVQMELEQQQQAEAAASAAMEAFTGAQESQSLRQNIESIENGLENMTQEQMQQAADALQQAADALQQTNPEAADALREAADALQQGDRQGAQEAMQRAGEETQRAQAEQRRQQAQQAQMQQGAQQAQRAQQQAAENGQEAEPQSEGQASEGQSDEPQQGEGEGGEFASEGETETDQANSASSAANAAAQGDPQSQSPVGSGGDGQGDGEGDLSQDATSREQTRSQNRDQTNNPDGSGERDYQAMFAPRFSVEAAGTDDVRLSADPGDEPLTQGEFDDNPLGVSVVPYNQVFRSYADAASRALESDYIPLGMRDVVRDYFSSLEPQQP